MSECVDIILIKTSHITYITLPVKSPAQWHDDLAAIVALHVLLGAGAADVSHRKDPVFRPSTNLHLATVVGT